MGNVYLILFLILIGYIFGQIREKKHYDSINQREQKMVNLITTTSKRPLGELDNILDARLVCGSVVISIDYFKRIVMILRSFFGGNIHGYETLLDRARREAVLRLKESCPDATQIINLRIETSSIFKGQGKQVGSVEMMAYATAIYT